MAARIPTNREIYTRKVYELLKTINEQYKFNPAHARILDTELKTLFNSANPVSPQGIPLQKCVEIMVRIKPELRNLLHGQLTYEQFIGVVNEFQKLGGYLEFINDYNLVQANQAPSWLVEEGSGDEAREAETEGQQAGVDQQGHRDINELTHEQPGGSSGPGFPGSSGQGAAATSTGRFRFIRREATPAPRSAIQRREENLAYKQAVAQRQQDSTPEQNTQKRVAQIQRRVERYKGLSSRESFTRTSLPRVSGPLGNAGRSLGSELGIASRKLTTRLPGFLGKFLPQGLRNALGLGGRGLSPNLFSQFTRGSGFRLLGGFRGGGLGGVGSGVGSVARAAAAGGPWLLAIILIILFLILLHMLFNPSTDKDAALVKIDKTGPTQVANGEVINYTITVLNKGLKAADIQVTDNLDSADIVSSVPEPDPSSTKSQIIWILRGIAPGATQTITLRVTPSFTNTWIQNRAEARIIGSGGGAVSVGAGAPPTKDNCGGKYQLNNPLGNFGDPGCNFTKDGLFTLIKQLDPENAIAWFNGIIPCESSYDSNAYNFDSTSGYGGYGLYQMNPAGKGTGQFDRGDVEWTVQTSNAINHNKYIISLGGKWSYWACAYKFPDYKKIPTR